MLPSMRFDQGPMVNANPTFLKKLCVLRDHYEPFGSELVVACRLDQSSIAQGLTLKGDKRSILDGSLYGGNYMLAPSLVSGESLLDIPKNALIFTSDSGVEDSRCAAAMFSVDAGGCGIGGGNSRVLAGGMEGWEESERYKSDSLIVVTNIDGTSQTVIRDPSLVSTDISINENATRIRASFQAQGIQIQTEIHTLTSGLQDILITNINGTPNTDTHYWEMCHNEAHAQTGLISLWHAKGVISFRYAKR